MRRRRRRASRPGRDGRRTSRPPGPRIPPRSASSRAHTPLETGHSVPIRKKTTALRSRGASKSWSVPDVVAEGQVRRRTGPLRRHPRPAAARAPGEDEPRRPRPRGEGEDRQDDPPPSSAPDRALPASRPATATTAGAGRCRDRRGRPSPVPERRGAMRRSRRTSEPGRGLSPIARGASIRIEAHRARRAARSAETGSSHL